MPLDRQPPPCALSDALAEQRRVVAAREEIEEPPVELLVHPEVARPAGLVREPAGGDHRHALGSRIGADDLVKNVAHLIRPLGPEGWAAPCSSWSPG